MTYPCFLFLVAIFNVSCLCAFHVLVLSLLLVLLESPYHSAILSHNQLSGAQRGIYRNLGEMLAPWITNATSEDRANKGRLMWKIHMHELCSVFEFKTTGCHEMEVSSFFYLSKSGRVVLLPSSSQPSSKLV